MGGLLGRRAPHLVEVQLREMQRTPAGLREMVNVGPPIPVKCAVQIARDWSSAEESLVGGLQILDLRVIYSRTWPGDVHSHIKWEGDWYEMVGAEGPLKMSRRTAHYRITCRRIKKAA